MIYYMLQSLSTTLFTIVNTIWFVEETLIRLMMTTFFLVLKLAFHPLMLVPMSAGAYYLMCKLCGRRRTALAEDGSAIRHVMRSPRGVSYRSVGSVSSRSVESCGYDTREQEIVR